VRTRYGQTCPPLDCNGEGYARTFQLHSPIQLIDLALDLSIQYQLDQDLLHFLLLDVQLLYRQQDQLSFTKTTETLTLAKKLISNRVYGFNRSIKYCVRSERRTSSMYDLMKGSSRIVDLLSVTASQHGSWRRVRRTYYG
jgi:hypothetical protein